LYLKSFASSTYRVFGGCALAVRLHNRLVVCASNCSPYSSGLCFLALVCLGSETTLAQTQTEGPSQGVFRGSEPTAAGGQTLALTGSLFGGYDDDLSATGIGEAGAGRGPSGAGKHSGLDLGFIYARGGRDVQFSASTSNTVRYYPDFSDLLPTSHAASAALRIRLTPRSNVSAQIASVYTPDFTFAPTLAPDATARDFQPLLAPYRDYAFSTLTYDANLGFNRELSSRSNLSARLGKRYTDFRKTPGKSTDQGAGVEFSNRFHRNTRMSLSYNHRQNYYASVVAADGEGRRTSVQDFDVRIDRDWPMSPTRGMAFHVRMGPSLLQQGRLQRYTANAGGGFEYRLRTWATEVSYRRGVNFVEGVADPIPSDSGNIAIRGLLGRRLNLLIDASLVTGEIGLDLQGSAYDSYSGIARLQLAVSRSVAVFGDYLYQQYSFGNGTPLPATYPRTRERHGVRVGMDLSVPLLKQRTNHGSR
jgi:hypothetical protein